MNSLYLRVGAHHNADTYEHSNGVTVTILGMAAEDLQVILGEAMETTTAMLPHKPTPDRGILLRHLWPKLSRHDISNIRRRAKASRRLARLPEMPPSMTHTSRHIDTPHFTME